MLANWINKNHEMAQLQQIREARENLRIALEAERKYKKERREKTLQNALEAIGIGLILVGITMAIGDLIVAVSL